MRLVLLAAAFSLVASLAEGGPHMPNHSGAGARLPRTVENFRSRVRKGTSFERVKELFGPPDLDVGSGIHIYVYTLEGGLRALLGFVTNDRILYAKIVDASGTETESIVATTTKGARPMKGSSLDSKEKARLIGLFRSAWSVRVYPEVRKEQPHHEHLNSLVMDGKFTDVAPIPCREFLARYPELAQSSAALERGPYSRLLYGDPKALEREAQCYSCSFALGTSGQVIGCIEPGGEVLVVIWQPEG